MDDSNTRALAFTVLLVLVILGGMVVLRPRQGAPTAPMVEPIPAGVVAPAVAINRAFESAAARIRPAVVGVYSERVVRVRGDGWPFGSGDGALRQFFGLPPEGEAPEQSIPQRGMGSGILLDRDGHVLTNQHVVAGVSRIRVQFADRRAFTARVVGSDPRADIAVIQIQGRVPPEVAPASFGNSDSLRVGDLVLAIGAPFGLTQTVTQGIVSATGRSNVGIEDFEDFVQTDASINPGNSGGPLVDVRGDVVGMNTAMATPLGQSAGIGFAIPSNLIRGELATLTRGGQVSRGVLGVIVQDLDPDLARAFHVTSDAGALVTQVQPGSAAAAAGIRPGDVIVRFAGRPVSDSRSLRIAVAGTPSGRRVPVVIVRDGTSRSIETTVTQEAGAPSAVTEPAPRGDPLARLGMEVEPLPPGLARREGLSSARGIVISAIQPGSVASLSGLRIGDVVVEVDHRPVATVGELQRVLQEGRGTGRILLRIQRQGASLYVILSDPGT